MVFIALGLTTIVGSIAGTLAVALAALFDPAILTPTTDNTSGGISVLPGGPSAPDTVPGEGGGNELTPGDSSGDPIELPPESASPFVPDIIP